jgi:hypothetical protein
MEHKYEVPAFAVTLCFHNAICEGSQGYVEFARDGIPQTQMQLPWQSTSFAKHNFLLLQSFFLHSTGDNKLHVYDTAFVETTTEICLRNSQQLVLMQEKTQQKLQQRTGKLFP